MLITNIIFILIITLDAQQATDYDVSAGRALPRLFRFKEREDYAF